MKIIDEILRREGWPKFTNLAADRGGATKGGITLQAWRDYRNDQTITAEDLERVTEPEARAFYLDQYVVEPRFNRIADANLRELAVDAAVNHGPYRAARWLQRALGVTADGDFGPISQAACAAQPAAETVLEMLAYRFQLYGRLVSRDPELKRATQAGFNLQAIFAAGWNNRGAEFVLIEARRHREESADSAAH